MLKYKITSWYIGKWRAWYRQYEYWILSPFIIPANRYSVGGRAIWRRFDSSFTLAAPQKALDPYDDIAFW